MVVEIEGCDGRARGRAHCNSVQTFPNHLSCGKETVVFQETQSPSHVLKADEPVRSWSFSFALKYLTDGLDLFVQNNALTSFCLKGPDALVNFCQATSSVDERKEGRSIDLRHLHTIELRSTWAYARRPRMQLQVPNFLIRCCRNCRLILQHERVRWFVDQSTVNDRYAPCHVR